MGKEFDLIEACTYYRFKDIDELTENDLKKISKNALGTETIDDEVKSEIETLDIDGVTMEELDLYECIRPETAYFEELVFEDMMNSYIGKHSYYLVFAAGCKWNGASGYKICSNYLETIYRGYEVSLYYKDHIEGKALICKESSHDVPMGNATVIIGISEDEKEKIENEYDFDEVEKFVENIIGDIV